MVKLYDGAHVHPSAQIADEVEIGQFTTIGADVRIGRGTRIGNCCTIEGHTTIGERNRIHSNVVIGSAPQDLKHRGEATRLEIGHDNVIREFVTINLGTRLGGGVTRLGSHNVLMACAHVAHDCELGDRIILSNNSLLGGHVKIESDAILSGGSAVHHFATIGRHAFVGGMTGVSRDVPPYMVHAGIQPRLLGVNVVGLKRRGFSHDQISAIKEAHRWLFRARLPLPEAVERCRDLMAMFAEVRVLVEFLQRQAAGKNGRAREADRQFE